MAQLLIGALSKATKVPQKTIRYYEGLGLLKPIQRTRVVSRVYDENAIPYCGSSATPNTWGFPLRKFGRCCGFGSERGTHAMSCKPSLSRS